MTEPADNPLHEPSYLSFPLRADPGGSGLSSSLRLAHVREQIEQVLFTDPGERVFLPDFGAGVSALVFEPANAALEELTAKRLRASLTEALQGEVDPRSLQIAVDASSGDSLQITISYALATISQREAHTFTVGQT